MKKWIATLSLILIVILLLRWHLFLTEQTTGEAQASETIHPTGTVEMVFLDIGQGDATLITFPNEQQMLVDCAIDARILESLGNHLPYYDKHIDYLVVSHPDKDHYGGCIDVLERFDIGTIVLSGFIKEQAFFQTFMESVDAEQAEVITITEPQSWDIASTTIEFLYPDQPIAELEHIPGTERENDANNSSIIFVLEFAGKRVLMPADAEAEIEEYLIEQYAEYLDVDIYKAGHHGSSGSSMQALVDLMSPAHTIFSAGADNHYGHPSPRIIKRMQRAGSQIWRTDLNGDILVTLDEDSIYVETE